MRRLGMHGLLRPGKGQFHSDEWRLLLFHERGEGEQRPARAVQFEPQFAPHIDVLVDGFAKRVHRTPPGQGRASARRASKSTLA